MEPTPRTRKLNETVKEALAEVLCEDISDPRLSFVTVTSVEVTRDLRHARVYVTTHGDVERYRAMLAGLESAKRRIRSALGTRVSMKYLPELAFLVDESVDEGVRIGEVLRHERAEGRAPADEGGHGDVTS